MPHRYRVVDVFTTQPLEGNPLAVFPDASGIDERTMQKIARELNLSETVFALPTVRSDCAARLKIFTPNQEMAFAGHPIIGASFVLLREGIVSRLSDRFALDVKVGPVSIRVESGARELIWLTTPSITSGASYDRAKCAEGLGLLRDDLLDVPPQQLSAGNPTIFIALKDVAAVDRAWLDLPGLRTINAGKQDAVCVFVFAPTREGAYSRMFAPAHGVPEDPATGSATGPLAAYMMRHKLIATTSGTRFQSEQGTKIGRRSILHVQINGDEGVDGIEVGGHVTPIVKATMTL